MHAVQVVIAMKGKVRKELLWIAFGVGCVAACCLPTIWITRVLAVAVIILGIICCKKYTGAFP